jgi:hypothetical protein
MASKLKMQLKRYVEPIEMREIMKKLILPIILCIFIGLSGCQKQQAINYDSVLSQISKLDPNEASRLTQKLFTEQQKSELEKIKAQAEADAYKKQENWKIIFVIGMGACIVAVIAGIWFGKKIIIALGAAGFLGNGASWGLIFAGLQYAKLIGLIVACLCLAFGIMLFGLFVWSVFKYRKALVQVVLGNEAVKHIVTSDANSQFRNTQRTFQNKTTEAIVDKIRNGNK